MTAITKIALVTGSSKGIGAAIVSLLGARGYTTVVTYRHDRAGAEKTADTIRTAGGIADICQLDVTAEDSVKACFERVAADHGRLDVLVNNAGVDGLSPIDDVTYEKWREITGPKIDGNFLCTKYALPLLKAAGKSDLIIIMSSLGDSPDINDIAYSVGTAGAVGFVKAMALALAKYGVRTNGVGPGEIRTGLGYWQERGLTSDEIWDGFAKANPLGRLATPEDVAETVLAIINNPTRFWNGNFIYVTGGNHIPQTEA